MRRRAAAALGILLTLAPLAARADTSGGVAPDAGAGKRRAAVCFACHGVGGVGVIPGIPHLAGQDRGYLEKSLRAYRDGGRVDPAMSAMAKPLSDADIANITAYFSMQGRPQNR